MVGFLSLPGEIRNMIYNNLLVAEEPIDPIYQLQKPLTGVNILCTNKTINCEASSLLYGQNCFDFSAYPCCSKNIIRFFDQIGRDNAGKIRRLRISYPRIDEDYAPFGN